MNRILAIRSVHDFARNVIFARYSRRRLHHRLPHDAQDDRHAKSQPSPADAAQRRNAFAQDVTREAHMARLFGDVDLHDSPKQRMSAVPVLAQALQLDIIDRIFASQYEDKEQLRDLARILDSELAPSAFEPVYRCNLEASPIDELLEHQRVL